MGQYEIVDHGHTFLAVGYGQTLVNGRLKYYPQQDGELLLGSVEVFDRGGFRRKGYEIDRTKKWVSSLHYIHDPSLDTVTYNPTTGQNVRKYGYTTAQDTPPFGDLAAPQKYNLDGSAKGRARARARLFDLVKCNWDLDCMFTLTFAPDRIDRTDYDAIIKQLRVWFDNRVRRAGLKYLAVPEYHADGEAIHIHGLCNFAALSTIYSGHRHGGRRVYNIADYPFGFTAVKRIGTGAADRQAVAIYVTKYITKSSAKVGGRYYLHGGSFQRPTVLLREISDDALAALVAATPVKAWSVPTPMGTYTKYTLQPPAPEKIPPANNPANFTLRGKSKKGKER